MLLSMSVHYKVTNCVNQFRTERCLTQEELAIAVGVTRQTIISIEKGNYTPSVLLALTLARYFEVAVEDLFTLTYE